MQTQSGNGPSLPESEASRPFHKPSIAFPLRVPARCLEVPEHPAAKCSHGDTAVRTNELHRGLLKAKTSSSITTPPCGTTADTQLLCSPIPQTRVKLCRLKKLLKLMELLICKHRGGWFMFLYPAMFTAMAH